MKGILVKYFFLVVVGSLTIFLLNANEEPYGYWKPIDVDVHIAEIATSLPEQLSKPSVYNTSFEGVVSNTIRSELENKVFADKNITQEEATKVATDFVNDIKSKLSLGDFEIKKIEPPNKFNDYYRFEYQRKGIPFCDEPSLAVRVRIDGYVESFGAYLYPNLTAPTRPKLSDEQVGKELTKVYEEKASERNIQIEVEPYQNSVCIFPKWHPDGEYWTYHLSKIYFVKDLDKLYYDIGGHAGILYRIEPIAG